MTRPPSRTASPSSPSEPSAASARLLPRPLRALLLAVVTGICLTTGGAPAASAEPSTGLATGKVDVFVESYLHRHGLPGAAVAVTRDGEVLHARGYGVDSAGQDVTGDTRLRIASVSKSFTAFAVLQLVDAGDVGLDRPVETYLPEFVMADPLASTITVRQLLSHTSGIPNPTIVAPAQTLEAGVARVRDWHLAAPPGTRYAYSNANYWIAARLVEVVTGVPFEDYLQTRVFAPAGMRDTVAVTTTAEPVAGLADGHVTAYGGAWPVSEPVTMDGGSGGVVSTAQDMARWLALQQRDGLTSDGTRLLSARLVEESHTPQPQAGRTGLGWVRSSAHIEPERISHSGAALSFQAQQDLVPSSGYGVVVMLNSFTPWLEHAYEISSGIIATTEGRSPAPGWPVPTLIDLGLGAVTVTAAVLGVRGVWRARGWAVRHSRWPRWRLTLRMLPQLVMPAVALLLFGVAPRLKNNSFTAGDVLQLAPSATILIAVAAVVGVVLVAARAVAVRAERRQQTQG